MYWGMKGAGSMSWDLSCHPGQEGALACFPSLSRHKGSHINSALPLKLTFETSAPGSEPRGHRRQCLLPSHCPALQRDSVVSDLGDQRIPALLPPLPPPCSWSPGWRVTVRVPRVHGVPCRGPSSDFRGFQTHRRPSMFGASPCRFGFVSSSCWLLCPWSHFTDEGTEALRG